MNGSPTVVPDQRLLRAAVGGASLSWQPVDAAGVPADPGEVTVGVTRADGTELLAAGTATTGNGTAARTVALTTGQLADLDVLTATWTVDDVTLAVTVAEIVGGLLLPAASVRSSDPVVKAADSRYPDSAIDAAVTETLVEFERITRRALTPRLAVAHLTGSGQSGLLLPHLLLTRVRWATVDGASINVDAVRPDDAGIATLPATVWLAGASVVIGYEHGYRHCPADLARAALIRVRDRLLQPRSGISDRATTVSGGEQTFLMARPGVWGNWTGNERVDEILRGYADRDQQIW